MSKGTLHIYMLREFIKCKKYIKNRGFAMQNTHMVDSIFFSHRVLSNE